MEAVAVLNAIFFIAAGFASGSVLYSVYLPKLIKGVDVTLTSADKNPGAYNAFVFGGVSVGIICLALDILKGFLPVLLAKSVIQSNSIAFAVILIAPVAGHAFSPLRRFHGGKGISVSFGVLLALLPEQLLVFVLAGVYLISLIMPLHINERRTIAAFTTFALVTMLMNSTASIKFGCFLIALLVNYKNWRDANITIPFWNQRRE
jgi:glycerol-3-phosphate acyltransferase PlsY